MRWSELVLPLTLALVGCGKGLPVFPEVSLVCKAKGKLHGRQAGSSSSACNCSSSPASCWTSYFASILVLWINVQRREWLQLDHRMEMQWQCGMEWLQEDRSPIELPCFPIPDLFNLGGGWMVCGTRLLRWIPQPSHFHVVYRQMS